ncbi:MAG: hypothetical protein ACYTBJ_16590 [Planctomycetota bacterium]
MRTRPGQRKERRRFREIIDRVFRDPAIGGVVFYKVDFACRNFVDSDVLERRQTADFGPTEGRDRPDNLQVDVVRWIFH